jgi:hypothetical protein
MPALFSEASISRLALRLAATSDPSDPTLNEEFRCGEERRLKAGGSQDWPPHNHP